MTNKKEMTRAQVIEELTMTAQLNCGKEDLIILFTQGWEGYKTLSNKELAADYWDLMRETLEERGYSGIYIIGKDLSYYESMERCLHKTITAYFAGAKDHEDKSQDTSFRDMTAEHRVIDILLFLKAKKSMH